MLIRTGNQELELRTSDLQRFEANTSTAPGPGNLTPCQLWTGRLDPDGYPIFTVGRGKKKRYTMAAHRIAYQVHRGPIPERLTLDHLCRVRHCVNPDHLDPCTIEENTRRSTLAPSQKNRAKTHCKNGHEFTEQNTKTNAKGYRSCRTCVAEANRRYRAKLALR